MFSVRQAGILISAHKLVGGLGFEPSGERLSGAKGGINPSHTSRDTARANEAVIRSQFDRSAYSFGRYSVAQMDHVASNKCFFGRVKNTFLALQATLRIRS